MGSWGGGILSKAGPWVVGGGILSKAGPWVVGGHPVLRLVHG